jgi:hypothetical protein
MRLTDQRGWIVGFVFFLGMCCMPAQDASAEKLWLDELSDSLIFYKGQYPQGNWSPYMRQLTLIKEGVDLGNPKLIRSAMEDLLTMLRTEAYGISGVAAHALYWIALGLQPSEPFFAAGGLRLDTAVAAQSLLRGNTCDA